jgi:pimeloyl-ACP methyl ester carboxylesterase
MSTSDDRPGQDTISILALHGYHGSAQALRRQLTPLASALPASVRLACVDAPSLSRGDFGWWHEGFRGWEQTCEWAAGLAARQRYHGVLGFSQGAALAGLLVAARETAARGEDSMPPGFGFALMIGGFTSEEPQHADLFQRPLTTPSLHVTGRADGIVPMRDSLRLAARFTDPVIIEHDGGHVIPGDRAGIQRILAFIEQQTSASRFRAPG